MHEFGEWKRWWLCAIALVYSVVFTNYVNVFTNLVDIFNDDECTFSQ